MKQHVPIILPALIGAASLAAMPDQDARIEAAARRSYNFRVHLKGDEIRVKAQQGRVTLSGTVADTWHRSLAEETVADLPGVKSVANELAIQGQQPSETSDAWLATKVRTALIYHRNVNATGTKVDVKDGRVTLTGEVTSAAQKALTGDICAELDGIKGVDNNLQVVVSRRGKPLAEKIDDASVTAQVKASLLFNRGTHMLTTRVRTDRGVVTIQGVSHNKAERELVTRLVSRINGVKRVDNRMTVEGS